MTVGPVSAGIELCQYQTLSGGLFRATLTGTGGSPQWIAVGHDHGDIVHSSTAPQGDPVRVDHWNYGATLATNMVAGVLVNIDPRPFLPYKKRPRITPAQKDAGVFTTAQRHPDQVGPTLKDGSWKDAHHQWHDQEGNSIPEPSNATAMTAQANANWIHDGQVGPTLMDGRWRVKGGANPWRYPNGKLAPKPTAQEIADANELTKSNPTAQEPLPTPDDLHGWTYQTTEGDPGGITPGYANPDSLLLDLPVQAPAPGSPTVVKTFEPWVASGVDAFAPAPGLTVTKGGPATCDEGSSDDFGSASAVRCFPPGNGTPCFFYTGAGNWGGPLLCSSDPTSKRSCR